MSIAPPGTSLPPPEKPELPAGVVSHNAMPAVTWTPLVAWLGGLGLFIGASMVAVIPLIFSGVSDPGPIGTAASIFAQDAALIAAVFFVVNASGSVSFPDSLGLRPTHFWKAAGIAVAAYVCLLAFSAIWDSIVSSPPEKLLDEVGANDSLLASILICFGVCVMAPLAEETLFRGFIFGGLRGWRGFWPAAIISGAMFGLAHLGGSPVEFIAPLALFGFLLASVYELTKSIFPGIYLHSFNNAVAFSIGLSLGWETVLVFAGSLSLITLALIATRRMA